MKTDARVRYTKMRIRKAFLECIERKSLNKITVKEICDIAEINRATFYTHYHDPFDLLDKLEEETLQGLREFISDSGQNKEHLLYAMISAMKNGDRAAVLFTSPHADPGFAAKIGSLYHELLISDVASRMPGLTEQQQNDVYFFLAGGCGNLISRWIEGGMQTPTETLAEDMKALCEAFSEAYMSRVITA